MFMLIFDLLVKYAKSSGRRGGDDFVSTFERWPLSAVTYDVDDNVDMVQFRPILGEELFTVGYYGGEKGPVGYITFCPPRAYCYRLYYAARVLSLPKRREGDLF